MLKWLMDLKKFSFKRVFVGFFLLYFKNYSLGFERELWSWLLDVVPTAALYAFCLKAWFPHFFSF